MNSRQEIIPKIGQTILVSSPAGERRVKVTHLSEDIKDGRAGFDGDFLNDTTGDYPNGVWGYLTDIIAIL